MVTKCSSGIDKVQPNNPINIYSVKHFFWKYNLEFCLEICQIRLDFVTTGLGQPTTTTGVCTAGDNLEITPGAGSLAGANPPTLCGTLTGQHCKSKICWKYQWESI